MSVGLCRLAAASAGRNPVCKGAGLLDDRKTSSFTADHEAVLRAWMHGNAALDDSRRLTSTAREYICRSLAGARLEGPSAALSLQLQPLLLLKQTTAAVAAAEDDPAVGATGK